MISLFALKNKGFCRLFIKTPYYIKNFVLLLQLGVLLGLIYLIYVSRDGMSIQNITRILKGLNSGTFNYLESHADSLRLTKLLNNYKQEISGNQFMDDCLRINKPCKFEGLAKQFPAFTKWQFDSNAYSYLLDKIGDQHVSTYIDLDNLDGFILSKVSQDSFKEDKLTLMKYSEFLEKMSQHSAGVTMKEGD